MDLLSIRYKNVHYVLHADPGFCNRVVKLLVKFPDAEHWRSLVGKAVVTNVWGQAWISHNVIEKIRQFVVAESGNVRPKRKGRVPVKVERFREQAMEAMADAETFRSFCEKDGCCWIRHEITSSPKLFYKSLELGVLFVTATKPAAIALSAPMLKHKFRLSTIDLDQGVVFVAERFSRLHFKIGSIPKCWRRVLELPLDWVELCYAYNSAAKKLLLSRLDHDETLALVLDKMCSPFGCFGDCLKFLELVQGFLSGEAGPLLEELGLNSLYSRTGELGKRLRERMVDAFYLLLDVYSMPSPFAAFRKWNEAIELISDSEEHTLCLSANETYVKAQGSCFR